MSIFPDSNSLTFPYRWKIPFPLTVSRPPCQYSILLYFFNKPTENKQARQKHDLDVKVYNTVPKIEKHLITFLHFHKIINPDEMAKDTNSLRTAVFKEKCVPRASGRLTTALNRINWRYRSKCLYYPTLLHRVQITRETSANFTQYLYSSHSPAHAKD